MPEKGEHENVANRIVAIPRQRDLGEKNLQIAAIPSM
jgi:hypothetical protein